MVLFLFIIMLLDVREEAGKVWNPANLMLGAAVSGCLGYAIFRVAGQFASGPDVTALSEPEGGDDVRLLGQALFSEHAAPVIVIGFLLLVAMAGVIVLCQQPKAQVKTGEVK
jgi:NADH-quinone oxidoreductase subunit J